MDAGSVGEVMETFLVSSNAVVCMTVAPSFDDCDLDVLSSGSGVLTIVLQKSFTFGGNFCL